MRAAFEKLRQAQQHTRRTEIGEQLHESVAAMTRHVRGTTKWCAQKYREASALVRDAGQATYMVTLGQTEQYDAPLLCQCLAADVLATDPYIHPDDLVLTVLALYNAVRDTDCCGRCRGKAAPCKDERETRCARRVRWLMRAKLLETRIAVVNYQFERNIQHAIERWMTDPVILGGVKDYLVCLQSDLW